MAEHNRAGGSGDSAGRDEDEPRVVIRDKRKFDADGNRRETAGEQSPAEPAAGAENGASAELSDADVNTQAELLDLRTQVTDRTTDLQRLSAEYANYRKRVERDRVLVGEVAAGRVIEALLPVLDDIERAGQHGDLTGAFKAVAEKLVTSLESFGLQSFGQPGDPFDPAVHEAVMHDQNDEVTEPTATSVMRKGYRQGERLLRPAMVGVSDPA
jgi:molecular chaperone GrpE